MRSMRAAASRRGSLGDSGSLGQEQRLPTSQRSRLSFLTPVDEAREDGDAARLRSDGYHLRSPTASPRVLFSSDEETENFPRQSRVTSARRLSGVSAKPTYRREAELAKTQRVSVVSRRSSLQPPLQNVSRELSRARRESHDPTGDMIGTTLNEKKQKKLVALFYWRRRTLETYLSAWKGAVFDAMPRGAPEHPHRELTLLRQYSPAPVRPLGRLGSVPHHDSTLLRNTIQRQRSDSSNSSVRQSNHRDRMNSLRDEYRQLKATALEQQQPPHPLESEPLQPPEDAAAKRTVFRERLRIYYLCFDAWREFVNESHAESHRLQEQALRHRRRGQLRKHFRYWAVSFLLIRSHEKRRWLRACQLGDRLMKRRRFRLWLRLHNWYQLVHHRTAAICRLREAHSVLRWQKWAARTIILRLASSRRRLVVLRRFYARLKSYRTHRRRKKLQCDSAVAMSERLSLRRAWLQLHRKVFTGEGSSRMNALSKVLAQKSAVTKWKRFVARRRECQIRAEQADCRLYEGLLRRFWRRWSCYMTLRSEQRAVYDYAARQWASHHKRKAIRALLSVRCTSIYERDQIKGAHAFYHRQIVSKALEAWRTHASMRRRSRELVSAREKRQYLLSFVAWRQFAKQSRRTNELGATLFSRNRGRILRRSMRLWLYRRKFSVALQFLDSWYSTRLLGKHLQLWRSATLHSRHWHEVIRVLRLTREAVIQRRIFTGWHRIAVGSRCRRRLIRLFQTKCLCRKLRSCIQGFDHHAKLQRIRRSRQRSRLEGAWHAWVTFTSDQQHQKESTVAAMQFYRVRRYSRAVNLWKHNAQRWIYKRQTTMVANRYLIQRIMLTCLRDWYKRCQMRRSRRALIEARVAKHHRSSLERYFFRWNAAARILCRERYQFHRLWCRAMLRRRQVAFFAWRTHVSEQNAHRQIVRGMKRKCAVRRGRKILRAWRMAAFVHKRCRLAAQAVSSRWRRRTLGCSFIAWRVIAAESHSDRMNMIKAAGFHREFLILWAFYGWQHAALERQVLREKQHRVVAAVRKQQLGRAVAVWKRKLYRHHDTKAMLVRAALCYQKRRRLKGVDAWCVFISRRRQGHAQAKRAVELAANNLKRRVFRAWLQHASGTRAFKLKLRAIFQTGEDSVQHRAFRCWRRYKSSETLERRAIQWRKRSLQRKVWRNWRQQVAFTRTMRANVLITNRLLQSNASRASFVRWKAFVATRQRSVRSLAQAIEYHKIRCYRSALARFLVTVRHARALELSKIFHLTHLQRQQFVNWQRGVIIQKNWRVQKASIAKRYQMIRVKSAFVAWRQLVHTKLQSLLAKADQHSNSLAIRHTWKMWKRMVHCQHLVGKFSTGRLRRKLHTSFREWTHFIQDQKLIRSHVDAAIAHIDRVIKQRIWERWMEYLGERQEYHRLNQAASSFYNMILLRRSFGILSTYATHRHEGHAKQLKADAFHLAASLRTCLEHWEAYVEHRRGRAATKQSEDEGIRKMAISLAIRRWHNRASTLRSLEAAETRAKKFFSRQAETAAIRLLVEHAAKKRSKRKHQAEAITYQRRQLSLQCFTRWKSFVAWRRRHHHLLRLFRSNQQSDYFALWRKYVARSQHKRTTQAIATRGYRNLVQRSVFKGWSERCHYWRGKRRAGQWYNHRLERYVLDVWSHRVRVVRKMRHMFRFQDAFRLETHFDTWKRYWWRKKQQIVRVQDAVVWFKKHKAGNYFSRWVQWTEMKRQEKQTMRMAIGFRIRFFSRKYLHAWRSVFEWKKRKALLLETAQQRFDYQLIYRAFDKIRAFAKLKKRLSESSTMLTNVLTDMKVQRFVDRWKQHLLHNRDARNLELTAEEHHRRIVALTIWRHLRTWHAVRRVKCSKWKRARSHSEIGSCRRALLAWVAHVRNQHRQRTGLQRFKDRYFRGVVDDCFLRWSKFVRFKRRLRLLKRNVERSRQRRALQAWCTITEDSRKRQSALEAIRSRRHRALLSQCVVHWESVATESWMYERLVRAALLAKERQLKCRVLLRWKSMLPLRRARQEWRERARVRHKSVLISCLRQWRWLTTENERDSDYSETSSN